MLTLFTGVKIPPGPHPPPAPSPLPLALGPKVLRAEAFGSGRGEGEKLGFCGVSAVSFCGEVNLIISLEGWNPV